MRSNGPTIALLGATLISLLPAVGSAQTRQGALDKRLQRVERLLDSSALKGLLQRVEAQQREIRALQGDNDVLNHKLQLLEQRLLAITTTSDPAKTAAPDTRITDASPTNTGTATGAAAPDDSISTAAPDQEQTTYNAAFKLLRNGEYAAAITALQQQLQDYPNGHYAANAQYWIGEAHYVEQRFDPAMQAFQQVTTHYPDSAKSPDAMLKIGIILSEQGKKDQARQIFQQLQQRFPDSSAASLAGTPVKQQ